MSRDVVGFLAVACGVRAAAGVARAAGAKLEIGVQRGALAIRFWKFRGGREAILNEPLNLA